MNYKTSVIKRKIEYIFIFPFVTLGKIIGLFYLPKSKSELFIFNPCADLGGSYKVNAEIGEVFKDKNPIFIFTKKPKNNGFLFLFQKKENTIIDISKWVDNKWFYFNNIIYRGIISTWINKCKKPIIIGGESMYFYKVLQHVKKQTLKIEVCHVNTWMNYNQAFIKFIDKRVFSTPKVKRDIEAQYLNNNISKKYVDRLLVIDNWVEIPNFKNFQNKQLEVLYIGRGVPIKRVHIISAIADSLKKDNKNVHFTFIGDVENVVSDYTKKHQTLLGNISNQNIIEEHYLKSDIIILTSLNEGLPIVVMQMMAHGKVVISTPAGGITDYIFNNKNGIIINELIDEQRIITLGIDAINKFIDNKLLLKTIGDEARKNAKELFTKEMFDKKYKALLNFF